MYFTPEDFQKIEEWFKCNAIKDTDFNIISAADISDDAILAIVDDNINRKVLYGDFVNRLQQKVNFINSDSINWQYNNGWLASVKAATRNTIGGLKIMNYINNTSPIHGTYPVVLGSQDYNPGYGFVQVPFANSNTAGLLSVQDKIKLDGLTQLQLYNPSGTPQETSVTSIANSGTVNWQHISMGMKSTTVAYVPDATSQASGAMSAADKQKLDDIEDGANNYELFVEYKENETGLDNDFTDNHINFGDGIAGTYIPYDTYGRLLLNLALDGESPYPDSDGVSFPIVDKYNRNKLCNIYIAYADDTDGGLMKPADKIKLDSLPLFTNITTRSSQGNGALFIDNTQSNSPILTQRVAYGLKDNYNTAGTKLDYYGVVSGARIYNIDIVYPQMYIRTGVNTNQDNYYIFNTTTHQITTDWSNLYRHGYLYFKDYTLKTNDTRQAEKLAAIKEYIEVRGAGSSIPNNYYNTVRVYLNLAALFMQFNIPGPREYVEWAVPNYGPSTQNGTYEYEGEEFPNYEGNGTLDVFLPQLTLLQNSLKAHVILNFHYAYFVNNDNHIIYHYFLLTGMTLTGIETPNNN